MAEKVEVTFRHSEEDFVLINLELGKYINKSYYYYFIGILFFIVGLSLYFWQKTMPQTSDAIASNWQIAGSVFLIAIICIMVGVKIGKKDAPRRAYNNPANKLLGEQQTVAVTSEKLMLTHGNDIITSYSWEAIEKSYESTQGIYLMTSQRQGVFLLKKNLTSTEEKQIKAFIEAQLSESKQQFIK